MWERQAGISIKAPTFLIHNSMQNKWHFTSHEAKHREHSMPWLWKTNSLYKNIDNMIMTWSDLVKISGKWSPCLAKWFLTGEFHMLVLKTMLIHRNKKQFTNDSFTAKLKFTKQESIRGHVGLAIWRKHDGFFYSMDYRTDVSMHWLIWWVLCRSTVNNTSEQTVAHRHVKDRGEGG
jgi:hypothetical protein